MNEQGDHDARREQSLDSESGHDTLGALISAAGRRPAPPESAYEQVFAAAHGAWRRSLEVRARRRRNYALAAAIAVLAVGAGLILEILPRTAESVVASAELVRGEAFMQPPGAPGWRPLASAADSIRAGTRLRTGSGGRLALSVQGDASLRVDAATTVTVAAVREIRLESGTIYIDAGIEPGPEGFVVSTPHGTVRDIGTQFEVSAAENTLRVRVREGAVSLAAGVSPEPLIGSAGEQISLAGDGSFERSPFSPFDSEWAWVESLAGSPEIEGRSLLLFLSWAARESGRELRFDAPATETRARTVVLHGNAENLPPLEALEAVLSTTDFQYALDGGVILISPRGTGP